MEACHQVHACEHIYPVTIHGGCTPGFGEDFVPATTIRLLSDRFARMIQCRKVFYGVFDARDIDEILGGNC